MADEHANNLFMEHVSRHQAELFSYLYALVHNLDDTRDLHQQTLMVLWQKFDQFEQGTNFMAWAVRVAQFEVLKHRRRQARPEVPLSEQVLEQLTESFARNEQGGTTSERYDALASCLAALQAADRRLIEQSYQQQCRVTQIAQELGRSDQSICNSLRRIRQSLLLCIERKLAQRTHP